MAQFTLTPSEVRTAVIKCIERGLVPMTTSSPGLGKSSIHQQIADDFKLKLIDIRLSQTVPEDMMGLPTRQENGKATFMPFEMFPTKGTPIPEGYNGWFILLDEFNSAGKSVQAAAYKLVLDRMAGQHELADEVFIACAGNLETDRAIVNPMSTAMQSRMVHLEMECSHKEFMEYAVSKKWDHRILGFLEYMPSKLHKFDPDHNDKTFACPRTWEFLNRLIEGEKVEDFNLPLMAGTISNGVAVEFNTFAQEYGKLPTFYEILANPAGIDIPESPSTKYALITMMLDKVDGEDLVKFEDVVTFVKRLPSEFQVIFFRQMAQRHPKIRREKVYASNILHLVKFLNSDD